ncbi:TraR/DksA family transcriptional regulator [Pinirhizobacter sp.]|uniref:TraR/DksA family transcriptional regulator n=1 Tax=Pinirhizobacter sp. TaxID=2950432 RepID=UPI002F3F5F97
MTNPAIHDLDAAFIERQRQRLLTLRAQLVKDGDLAGVDEDALQMAAGDEPQDAVDDGDRLEQQANDEAVLARVKMRVIAIDRALEKITERTYGLSDGNGQAIGRAHLEAVPEAVFTTDELRMRERRH